MRLYLSFIAIAFIIILIDTYFYLGLRTLFWNSVKRKMIRSLYILHWLISLVFLSGMVVIFYKRPDYQDVGYFQQIFWFLSVMLSIYLPKLMFLSFRFLDDLNHWSRKLLFSERYQLNFNRRKLFSQIALLLALIPMLSSFYGVFIGKFQFKVYEETIHFENLPEEFDGLRIVQLSDFHISAFYRNEDKLEKVVNMVQELKPDLIVFTGDMVNNTAAEFEPFVDYLKGLSAPLGKFAILGNHDYGDYMQWENDSVKQADVAQLIAMEIEAGFQVLLNESYPLVIHTDTIYLLGLENWGKPPFPQYGNLELTMRRVPENSFEVLLSHDPSHWDAEVLGNTAIELTLSGHTHGMQVGIENDWFKWSPVKYKYPRWAGLYQEASQYLYVNRGIGFIAYSGRVGILPEISLLTLHRK